MNTCIEMIPSYRVAYMRRTGPYGSENAKIMEKLKSWVKKMNLLNQGSIILGIAQDDPQYTDPQNCRYDACLVVSDEFKIDDKYINLGKIIGGEYCIFKISHTAEAIQKAWMEIFEELSKRNYQFDDKRPILERYTIQMINKHFCEICVPIL